MEPILPNMVDENALAPPPAPVAVPKKKGEVRLPAAPPAPAAPQGLMSLEQLQAAFAASQGQPGAGAAPAAPAGPPTPNPFAAGYSTTTTPGGERITLPLGADMGSAAFSKQAGSSNQGDVMDAFRQQMAKMPRSFTASMGEGGIPVFNPESEAQYQQRGMAQFKTANDMASEAEKQGLARILGIGNLGVAQGNLGVNAGHLEVQQRAQQMNEAKLRHEMSKGATADKMLATLLTTPGMDPGKARSLMMQFQSSHQGYDPNAPQNAAQPFRGNNTLGLMGMGGGGQPSAPTPGVQGPSPGPVRLGPVGVGAELNPAGGAQMPAPAAAGATPPAPPGGHPQAPEPSVLFGHGAVEAANHPDIKTPEQFLLAIKQHLPGGEAEFAQKLPAIMKYAATKFKQEDIAEAVQPSRLNALSQRFAGVFRKRTPESEVLMSQIRNAQGKPPSATVQNEDQLRGDLQNVGRWWGDALGGRDVRTPAPVSWLQRALGGQ